jgi:DNA-binding transcriptional MerR regulator
MTLRHSLGCFMEVESEVRDATQKLWQTREFANLAGVTVRTLHHYDRLGLLKPTRRTSKGFRLYGERDFARLQQITTLKFIGFSLSQIKEILGPKQFDLSETLRLQRIVLKAQRDRLDLALEAITRAEKTFDRSNAVDWDSFKEIIEVINMEQNMDWTKGYYSESAQAKIEERKHLWSLELQERVSRHWAELVADVEAAMGDGTEPSESRAQALANRWRALVDEFTGGDREIQAGLNKMYSDQKNWPETTWKKPFSNDVQNFIAEAMKYSS